MTSTGIGFETRRGLIGACTLAPVFARGTAAGADTRAADDTSWYRRQLIEENARPRLRFALAENGFYRPNLARDWRPQGEQLAFLVTQTRAIYLMAAAYQVSGERAFLDAVRAASNFFVEHFGDLRQPGRWAKAVAPDGRVVDASYHAYGQTHAIFAMAHAYQATRDQSYLRAALATWAEFDVPRVLDGRRPGLRLDGLNVAMHLFEGLLALYKATRSDLVASDLRVIGSHIVERFVDSRGGFLHEDLDQNYQPRPTGEVRLGHNAETAFLLSRAVDAGLPRAYLDAALRAIDFVVARGIDRADGSLPHELNQDATVRDPQRYWWCQTELLRALAHFIHHRGRQDFQPAYDRCLAFAKAQFIDPVHGGWYARPGGADQRKGYDWKAGYHVAMMQTEVLRLRGHRFQSGAEILL